MIKEKEKQNNSRCMFTTISFISLSMHSYWFLNYHQSQLAKINMTDIIDAIGAQSILGYFEEHLIMDIQVSIIPSFSLQSVQFPFIMSVWMFYRYWQRERCSPISLRQDCVAIKTKTQYENHHAKTLQRS